MASYQTRVTAVGGRKGRIISDDGLLDLPLSLPKAMGGTGMATNPEQLFAGGYAACFENAILHVASRKKLSLADDDVTVVATVGLGANAEGGFVLSVALETTIKGMTQPEAEALVAAAHAVCPYSNAVKGNIEVGLVTHVE
ncbi:organic hydroperoxide resistance protein [Actibacterium sp. D379-3]